MSYRNEKNGWIDNGKIINKRPCPNCKSNKYTETVSREYCPDCGLECDYWGKGANNVYRGLMERNWEQQERKRQEENKRYYEEMQPPEDWD